VKLRYFLVADSAAVDQSTNRLSLFNLIDEIHIPPVTQRPPDQSPPIFMTQLCIVASWDIETGDEKQDWQLSIVAHLPKEEEKTFPINFRMEPGKRIHRVIMNFVGLPIRDEGNVRLAVLLNNRPQGEQIIPVIRDGAIQLMTQH
jgi:hypothetical protein